MSECERVNWWASKFFVFELSNTDRVIEGPGASGRASGLFTVYCHLFLLLAQRVLLLQCHVGFFSFFSNVSIFYWQVLITASSS